MKYFIKMRSGVMIHMPSFKQIDTVIQKLMG
jgi:hypothetical protein